MSQKLRRAELLISEYAALSQRTPMFDYMLFTDWERGERYTQAQPNRAAQEALAAIAADAVQNLRSALDHEWWARVADGSDAAKQRQVQFPFSTTRDRLDAQITSRLAGLDSPRLRDCILRLQPYPDGDLFLWATDALSIPERHREVTPVGELKHVDFRKLREAAPDFPSGVHGGMTIRDCSKDISWTVRAGTKPTGWAAMANAEKLPIPISAIYAVGTPLPGVEIGDALNRMCNRCIAAIEALRATV